MTQVTGTGAAPDAGAAPPSFVNVDDRGVAQVDPAARAKEQEAAAAKKDDRPTWLDEKFKSPEEMAAAYKELEKKLGAPKQETQATPAEATKKVEQAGLDNKALAREIAESGKLSDASIKALKDKGIDDATIAAHVEGAKALAANFRTSLATVVGGEDNLKAVGEWAKTNLSDAEAEAFDAALSSGNEALAKMALAGVNARFVAAEGRDPKLVTGAGEHAEVVQPFRDSSEVTAAMRDPRYRTSEAYRQDVAKRLSASALFHERR